MFNYYGITVEKVLESQWAKKFCDWMAMANNAWRHKHYYKIGEVYNVTIVRVRG